MTSSSIKPNASLLEKPFRLEFLLHLPEPPKPRLSRGAPQDRPTSHACRRPAGPPGAAPRTPGRTPTAGHRPCTPERGAEPRTPAAAPEDERERERKRAPTRRRDAGAGVSREWAGGTGRNRAGPAAAGAGAGAGAGRRGAAAGFLVSARRVGVASVRGRGYAAPGQSAHGTPPLSANRRREGAGAAPRRTNRTAPASPQLSPGCGR